ncbi:MAG: DsrE family protein [Sulfuritalea sp.]|jgi:uncharacterized protein involved in oxidation of intracellular sulfur|nr:DsrE family protein [Sulfuritalea sp.]
MKSFLFILNDAPYGSERSYNGLRLANAIARREDHAVRVFLMGDAATCARRGQKLPVGYYSIETMLGNLHRHSGEVGVCGTCMDARGLTEDDLIEGCHRGTLDELAGWTGAADQVLVF